MLINLHGRETMYAITVPMVSFVALFTRDTGSTLESTWCAATQQLVAA
jgi:hypothetical protein